MNESDPSSPPCAGEEKRATFGKIGLLLSVLPLLVCLVVLLVEPTPRPPDAAHWDEAARNELARDLQLASDFAWLATNVWWLEPAAALVSIVGLFRDSKKRYAIAGAATSRFFCAFLAR